MAVSIKNLWRPENCCPMVTPRNLKQRLRKSAKINELVSDQALFRVGGDLISVACNCFHPIFVMYDVCLFNYTELHLHFLYNECAS